jgi:hypothetical protein
MGGFRSGKELIELGPIWISSDRFDVAPADLQRGTAYKGIIE